MTITVKQLSAMFENINKGKFKNVKQIDENLWQCNGHVIEKMYVSKEDYLVQSFTKDYWFHSFGDAVEFCMNDEYYF